MKRYRRAAAMGAAAEMLKDRREYIRAMEQRKLDHLTTEGAKRKKAVLDARVKFQNAADYLTSKGMDEDKVVSVFMSNPEEGMLLAKAAQDQELKGNTISSEILNRAVTVAQGFEPGKLSVSEAIERITPVFSQSKDPVAQERGMWASIFESGPAAVNRKIAQASLYGVSGSDVQASLGSPLYSAAPGTDKAAIDIGSFVKGTKGRAPAEIALLQNRMFEDYDNNLKVELRTLLGKGKEATPDEVERRNELLEIEKLPKSDRVAALIQDPQFGPAIANKYFTMEPKVFTAAEFGMSAFDAVSSYEAPSEEGEPTVKSDGSIDQSSASGAAITTVTSTNSAGLNVNEAGTPVFESEEEAKKAVENQQIKATTEVIINGEVAEIKLPSLSERFEGRFDRDMTKADIARLATEESAEELGETVTAVGEAAIDVGATLGDWLDRNILGRGVGSFNDLSSTITAGLAWATDKAGFSETANGLYEASFDMSEGAENMREVGFFENALKTMQSDEYLESDFIKDAAKFLAENMPDQPGMPTEKDILEGTKKGEALNAALTEVYNFMFANKEQDMEARIRDDSRQFRQDEKSYPQNAYIPPPSVAKDETPREVISYEQWLDMSGDEREALGLPKTKTGIQQIVRGGVIELPEGVSAPGISVMSSYSDQPMDGVPPASEVDTTGKPRNMAVEAMTTRRDRAAGLMGRPSEAETRPDLGVATISRQVGKIHGSGSKVTKDFQKKVSSGKIKAADVTRLIKDTQKLPRSDSRQELLASLYELRDTLNKR